MKIKSFWVILLAGILLAACGNSNEKKVLGHYTYQHGWAYPVEEGWLNVHETGTMDFHAKGEALDSAQQVYTLSTLDSAKVTFVFRYVSPSRWRIEDTSFYFSGVEEVFRMELLSSDVEGPDSTLVKYDSLWRDSFARKTITQITGGVAHEVCFRLALLTDHELVWNYTYPDGHTDTWRFVR